MGKKRRCRLPVLHQVFQVLLLHFLVVRVHVGQNCASGIRGRRSAHMHAAWKVVRKRTMHTVQLRGLHMSLCV